MRALSFIALFQAAGGVMFLAIFGGRLEASHEPIRRLGLAAAIVGIALVVLHLSLEAARMAGELSGVFDASLQMLVLDSPMSVGASLRVSGLVAIAAALSQRGTISRTRMRVGLAGVSLTIAGFLFVGHTAVHSHRAWLVMFLSVHLAVIAFWFGSLIPLLLVSRRETIARATELVDRFSQIATVGVPGILAAGIALMLLLVDRWAVFAEGYGLSLLAKIAGFFVLMWLAALNKWRYARVLESPSIALAFQRTVVVEYALICAVLTVTAWMTTFFSP